MNKRNLIAGFAGLLLSGAALADATSYTADLGHAAVVSESRHFGTSTTFVKYSVKAGSIAIDPAAQTAGGTFVVDVTSLQSNVPKLDTHLKSADFFDVANYPDATFVITGAKFAGDKLTELSGSLAMKGKVAPVTLTALNYNCYVSPLLKKSVCGGDFEAVIQRSQWDIKTLIPIVSDETRLRVQIEATKD